MKYALIGCGRIAVNHLKAAVNNNLDIVAVCDIIMKKATGILTHHNLIESDNIMCYTNYKEMIDNHPELQLIAIATSSGQHAKLALYCIERGINVIIEKPIAMSMSDAEKIIKNAAQKNVKVSVCHQNRFNVAVQQMKEALNKGRFGKLSHGSIHVRWSRDRAYYEQARWRGTWTDDGGCLMNQCIHGIDLLRWMMGDEVDTVYGVTRRQQHDYIEAEDVGMAVISFKNGAIATVEGTTNVFPQNLEETLFLFGEKGTVKIGGKSTNNIEVWNFEDETEDDEGKEGFEEITFNVYGNGHSLLYADVIDAINNNRQPYVNAVSGRNALELVLAIYESMKEGKVIHMPLEDFSSTDMKGIF